MQALVSIIMPTFNAEKFVSKAIASVQNQTHTNWQLIAVDDCSQDETMQILKHFTKHDNRIEVFELVQNSGTGIARNFALSKCKGAFIAFLDADDLWKPKKLETQLSFMTLNNLPFTFSFYEIIGENGNLLGKTITAPQNLTYTKLFFCNFIGNLTAIYEVGFFGKININPARKRQDWMLWLTILKRINTAKPVPESLAFYSIRNDSISASKFNLLQHNFNVYRKFHGFNILKASFCMVGFLFVQLFLKQFFSINTKK
jgi:teichuronic acid biosynthesis glycosyltransferase TuaG